MRLSIIPIVSYQNNNSFRVATEWETRLGAQDLYFQFVDLDQDGIRQMLGGSAAVTVSFPGFSATLSKTATVADALDRSIWKISLSATDVVFGGNIQIQVVDGGVTKTFWAYDVLVVEPSNPDSCSTCGGGCGGDCC